MHAVKHDECEVAPFTSWCCTDDPMVLSNIFAQENSVSIWRRRQNQVIARYFENVFGALGLGLRGVFSLGSLREKLALALPEGEGKQHVVEDIYLLADMLTTLFDCEEVGLRLAPLTTAMCPRFHQDNIPVRLVHTYLGDGTQWLPKEALGENQLSCDSAVKTQSRDDRRQQAYRYRQQDIHQMQAFDVGLLKGKAWHGHEKSAALHRSCPIEGESKRVLLSLDPM